MKKSLFILSALSMLFSASCTTTEPDLDGKPILEISKSRIVNDGVDAVTFAVTINGVDVTADSKIYTMNTSAELYSGTTFTSTEVGKYRFFANCFDKSTPEVIIVVNKPAVGLPEDPQPASTDFYNRVMVMQFTGTGCGFCPAVSAALKDLVKSDYKDKMEIVSIHAFNANDPMYSKIAVDISGSMGITGFPMVAYNMRSKTTHSHQGPIIATRKKIESLINSQYEDVSFAAISASSVKVGNDLEVSVSVKAGETGEYRVGLYILEDGVKVAQSGDGPDYDGYDLNIHNNAVRATYEGSDYPFYGENLGVIEAGKESSVLLNAKLSESWKVSDLSKCRLVIYVTSRDSETAAKFYTRNIIACPLEGKVPYAYNK